MQRRRWDHSLCLRFPQCFNKSMAAGEFFLQKLTLICFMVVLSKMLWCKLQIFFFYYYFIFIFVIFLSTLSFFMKENQHMRRNRFWGSDPGPRCVNFSSNAFFPPFFSVFSWVCAGLPLVCLHWKFFAKRQEVMTLKPSLVRRWTGAAMNGSFRERQAELLLIHFKEERGKQERGL